MQLEMGIIKIEVSLWMTSSVDVNVPAIEDTPRRGGQKEERTLEVSFRDGIT